MMLRQVNQRYPSTFGRSLRTTASRPSKSLRVLVPSRGYAIADPKIVKSSLKISNLENNLKTQTNRLERTLSKFWEKVGVIESEDGLEVQLDGTTMKTPLGNKLAVPKSKKTLAHLVANEWRNIPTLSIKPHSLPLTSLVSRTIDLQNARESNDPELIAKVGNLEDIQEYLLRYLDTDTLLVFSPKKDCDGTLRPAQEKMYRPIIKSLEKYLQESTGLQPFELSYLDCDIAMVGNKQSDEIKETVTKWMSGLDIWKMVALEKATLTAKSFLCGVALVRMHDDSVTLSDEELLDLEDIVNAATLETTLQTGIWGEVEDTHDVDKVDVRRNLASASLIIFDA